MSITAEEEQLIVVAPETDEERKALVAFCVAHWEAEQEGSS